jgi:O-acetyl-ADP-ribose deacetylase (regulator of RNase III)
MAIVVAGVVTPLIGDLFESRAQTLVNTVNCVGIMGKGIALGFKQRYPDMFRDYAKRCSRGEVQLGRPYLWTPVIPPWILNFPTKDHWRSNARLDAIVDGLMYVEQHYKEWGITSLAVPPLGCGEGGLEWRVVGPTLYEHLSKLDIPVELYAPWGTPRELLERDFLGAPPATSDDVLRLRPAAVATALIVERLSQQPYRPAAGRTTVQKIGYFLTEAGAPTGYIHVQGQFGPYSAEAAEAGRKLMNNGVLIEERIGQTLAAKPGPTIRDAERLYQSELGNWGDALDRVTDLFMRIRSTRQAEVAATVHFAAKTLRQEKGQDPSEIDVFQYVRQWKKRRKPPLTDTDIAAAIRGLNALGWIEVGASEDLPVPP